MRTAVFLLVVAVLVSACAASQGAAAAPTTGGSIAAYQQLRNVGLAGGSLGIDDYTLRRDAGVFHFRNGSFYPLAPVGGKVTGAVFVGEGTFILKPPLESENPLLRILTKESEFVEHFNVAVLRFTDRTYDELKAAGKAGTSADGGAAGALKDTLDVCQKKLHWNLTARVLADVLRDQPGGLFVAFIKGKKYSGKMIYMIDPTGAPGVLPEEISLYTYDDNKEGIWTAFHYSSEYAMGKASGTEFNAPIDVEQQKLETRLDRSGYIRGNATANFTARIPLRMVPFDLYKTLRVEKVTGPGGQPLEFIQEGKFDDPDYWVILPKPLAAGEKYSITTVYEGKEAILDTGSGNYFPIARENWYPNSRPFADYTSYDMTFSVPKQLQVVATGEPVSDKEDGDQRVSVWHTEVPQAVAGFSYGLFKQEDAKLPKQGYVVQGFANKEPPAWARELDRMTGPAQGTIGQGLNQGYAAGTFSSVSKNKEALSEAQNAVKLYDQYFGSMPYKRLAITQQTACNFGQSWPQLVYLPVCSFLTSTERHLLGMDFADRGYWLSVTAHEVAHQWWGHSVGFSSYRDQWMSEGFSVFSAGLYVQAVSSDPKRAIKYWDDWQEILTMKNKEGKRPIDVGPVTVGYRLANSRTGFDVPQRLIYPKGGYILHMIRMMMFDEKTGDQKFKTMMQEFVSTYRNRPATTEDFKAVVEKHMTPAMNLMGDGKMDWFFNEYVYGMALPTYNLEYSFHDGPKGGVIMKMKATQSNVDKDFAMVVPLYVDLGKDKVIRLGTLNMFGNTSVEHEIPLPLKEPPKKVMLNYFDDVLAGK